MEDIKSQIKLWKRSRINRIKMLRNMKKNKPSKDAKDSALYLVTDESQFFNEENRTYITSDGVQIISELQVSKPNAISFNISFTKAKTDAGENAIQIHDNIGTFPIVNLPL
jgi:hypothetical protein